MPGCAPGGAPSFLACPRKEGKRRAPHWLRPFAALPPLTPPPARLGASRGASGTERAIAALGHGWYGYQCPSARAEKRRGWGGCGHRRMAALRALTGCGCLSGALQAQSEFRSAAPGPSIAGCPQGHGRWGRLFFAYFLLATQKKVGALPGAHPGRRRQTSKQIQPLVKTAQAELQAKSPSSAIPTSAISYKFRSKTHGPQIHHLQGRRAAGRH
jgi:hypothetical protein